MDRNEILCILSRMCANGWIAIRVDTLHTLREIILPSQARMFTSDLIVGIVKPYIEKKHLSGGNLAIQMRTMSLMRALCWRLRDVQDRNWINGCLVDGGDVEVRPLYPRYLQRSWKTAFLLLIEQVKA